MRTEIKTAAERYSETKDEKLKNDIIKENSALIHDIINKSFNYVNLYDDMYQEGCLGLMKAAEKYDPKQGKFSTLATLAIRNNIIMFLKKSSHEYGSHLHRRTNVGDEPLLNIKDDKKSLGVFEAVGHVFSKMPQNEVEILKCRFGFKEGKHTYFQQSRALLNFKKIMKAEGIKRSDFYFG